MKITICGSLAHYKEMLDAREFLMSRGIEVEFPHSAQKILDGETTLEEIQTSKEDFSTNANEVKFGLITKHMNKIIDSDAILVINEEKKGIANYVGGNTLMEMAFAIAFEKKIYLLNGLPELSYTDEIAGSLPVILDGDLDRIVIE